MARQGKKIARRLKARIDAYNNITSKETLASQGMSFNKPGSQNRKK